MNEYHLKEQKRLNANNPKVELNQDVKGVGKKGKSGWLFWHPDKDLVERKAFDYITVEFEGNKNFRKVSARFLQNCI
ncbi:hypothetical protein [Flavobacterium sp.]|uniref:hypothetical protein n=1 Tax=Flavobacterium sp. TaxID=239 RepID=UPI00391B2CE9